MDVLSASEAETEQFGARLAAVLVPGMVISLDGPLGAGKTTLMRGLLRALGWQGGVRSPTYTLVESYKLGRFLLHHFDLYRLADPAELEFIGLRDYLDGQAVCMVEWAERGAGVLPVADLTVEITYEDGGRRISCDSCTETGRLQLHQI